MKKITLFILLAITINLSAQITTSTAVGLNGEGYYTSTDFATRGSWGTVGRQVTPEESSAGIFTWEWSSVPLGNNIYTGANVPFLIRSESYSVVGYANGVTINNVGDFDNVEVYQASANFNTVVKGLYDITFVVDTNQDPAVKTVTFELIQDYYHNLSFGFRGFNLPLGDGTTINDWSGEQNIKNATREGNVYKTTWSNLEFPFTSGLYFVDEQDIVRNGLLNTINYIESNLTLAGNSFAGTPAVLRNEANETFEFSAGTYDIELKIVADYSQDGDFITVTINPTAVASLSSYELKSIKVTPNPAKDFITIHTEKKIERVEFFNISGVKVLSAIHTTTVSIVNLVRGIYIVKAYDSNGGVSISKIVKK
tara:strand:+ start:885 stop:1988 length:1104 start_codon:yes stop_codon:yes gene_type:complete